MGEHESEETVSILLEIPEKMHQKITRLSKENMQTLEKEIIYRLSHGVKMARDIEENHMGLMDAIAHIRGLEDCLNPQ